MSSLLDDPAVRQAVYTLSVEFYHSAGELGLLAEDVELLVGTLVRKMPKSPLHSWAGRTAWLSTRAQPTGFAERTLQLGGARLGESRRW